MQQKIKENSAIILSRIQKYHHYKGPQVGDYLFLKDKGYIRFAHEWDDDMQTANGFGSFYLAENGKASMSGGLNSGIDKKLIVVTNEIKPAEFWIFDRDIARAGGAYNFLFNVSVYKLID
jgi:hypothetical protein